MSATGFYDMFCELALSSHFLDLICPFSSYLLILEAMDWIMIDFVMKAQATIFAAVENEN